ncbi:MAG: hypothetical protein EX269_14070 [Acidimicrobiales bacterium]|nr:MAG: hypothetical protein EX269_14070 [Acidimicrobiales bacterium]
MLFNASAVLTVAVGRTGHLAAMENSFEDLPRDGEGQAIIGDPRNDENLMISGLHVVFLLFHNAVLDRVEASGLREDAAFTEAQRPSYRANLAGDLRTPEDSRRGAEFQLIHLPSMGRIV